MEQDELRLFVELTEDVFAGGTLSKLLVPPKIPASPRPSAWPDLFRTAIKNHWPEYVAEAILLGSFMISACFFTTLLEHPDSVLRHLIPDSFVRRALIGVAMGLTAIGLIYSPVGKLSGAHMNPAITLTFWRLKKIAPEDVFLYIIAQFIGAVAGVSLSDLILGMAIEDAAVNYAVTRPGDPGISVAFLAELVISFGMMLLVLTVSNRIPIARFTGLFAGILVALFITFEAPLSGMSMNPARTFGSALPAHYWTALWVYFTAPVIGMVLAAELYTRVMGHHGVFCAKLHHQNHMRCIFCEYHRHPEKHPDKLLTTA